MKNKAYFIIFVVIIISISGIVLNFGYLYANEYKIDKSNDLYAKAVIETNPQERFIYLIESNLLISTESKIVQIAESALEANNNILADEYIKKITNQEVLNELLVFKSFSAGDYESADNLSLEPVTNIGLLIQSIYSNSYPISSNGSALLLNIKNISNEKEGLDIKIEIAKLFMDYNQPFLSLYVLDSPINEHKCLTVLYEYQARSYEMLNDYEKSLESIESAISCNIVDISLYEQAMNYSQIIGDSAKENLYKDKMKYLNMIND